MAFDSHIMPVQRLNRLSQITILSWVAIISLLQHQVCASLGKNSFSPLTLTSYRGGHSHDNEVITMNVHVRDILNARLGLVLTGKRKSLFTKKYKRALDAIDGEYTTIISAHGRKADHLKNEEKVGPMVINGTNMEHLDAHNIFPEDVSSLELVLTPAMQQIAHQEIKIRNKMECAQDQSNMSSQFLYAPRLILRAMGLGFYFTPVFSTVGLAAISQSFRQKYWYRLVAHCLSSCGPAFIKWGQWASTRSDMFPDSLCVSLSGLHADAPAHSWRFTKRSVEQALCIKKGSLLEVFQSFDEMPIASGSIAQIHKATLRSRTGKNGTVAVKVRHPNVSRLIDMDFRIMTMLANFVDYIPALSWLRVRSSVEQFSHTMAAQTHLNVEAHHLEVLNHNFRHWKHVSFPRPLFACSNVIVETFQKGQICTALIDEYQLSHDTSLVKDTPSHELMPVELSKFIVTTGLAIYLKMLLVDNLMHADLHPGNIMLDIDFFGGNHGDYTRKNSSQEKVSKRIAHKNNNNGSLRGKVTLVDAGMVAELQDDEIENFAGLMSSLGAGDGRSAGEAVLKFSSQTDGLKYDEDNYAGDLTLEQREAFVEDMVILFEDICKGYGTNVDVGEVLRGVLLLVRRHHVRIDANYATLVVNALCIESLAKRVCPTYNVLDAAKPLLKSHRRLFRTFLKKRRNNMFRCTRSMRQSLMKTMTPVLFTIKNNFDTNFFRNLKANRTKERKYPSQSKKSHTDKRWQLFQGLVSVGIIFVSTRESSRANADLTSRSVRDTQNFLK